MQFPKLQLLVEDIKTTSTFRQSLKDAIVIGLIDLQPGRAASAIKDKLIGLERERGAIETQTFDAAPRVV